MYTSIDLGEIEHILHRFGREHERVASLLQAKHFNTKAREPNEN